MSGDLLSDEGNKGAGDGEMRKLNKAFGEVTVKGDLGFWYLH